jgi:hypothetical protein
MLKKDIALRKLTNMVLAANKINNELLLDENKFYIEEKHEIDNSINLNKYE